MGKMPYLCFPRIEIAMKRPQGRMVGHPQRSLILTIVRETKKRKQEKTKTMSSTYGSTQTQPKINNPDTLTDSATLTCYGSNLIRKNRHLYATQLQFGCAVHV